LLCPSSSPALSSDSPPSDVHPEQLEDDLSPSSISDLSPRLYYQAPSASPSLRLTPPTLGVAGQTAASKAARAPLINGLIARLGLALLPEIAFPWCVRLFADFVTACGVSSLRGPMRDEIGALGSSVRVTSFSFYGTFSPPRMPVMIGCCSIADRMRVTLTLKTTRFGGADAQRLLEDLPRALSELEHAVTYARTSR